MGGVWTTLEGLMSSLTRIPTLQARMNVASVDRLGSSTFGDALSRVSQPQQYAALLSGNGQTSADAAEESWVVPKRGGGPLVRFSPGAPVVIEGASPSPAFAKGVDLREAGSSRNVAVREGDGRVGTISGLGGASVEVILDPTGGASLRYPNQTVFVSGSYAGSWNGRDAIVLNTGPGAWSVAVFEDTSPILYADLMAYLD